MIGPTAPTVLNMLSIKLEIYYVNDESMKINVNTKYIKGKV